MSTPDQIAHRFWQNHLPMRITMAEAMALPEYSATHPTGVIEGKMWRRHNGMFDRNAKALGITPRWLICRYDFGDATHCKVGLYRPVVRVKMGRRYVED